VHNFMIARLEATIWLSISAYEICVVHLLPRENWWQIYILASRIPDIYQLYQLIIYAIMKFLLHCANILQDLLLYYFIHFPSGIAFSAYIESVFCYERRELSQKFAGLCLPALTRLLIAIKNRLINE
jgi:hypothetical protein